MDKDNAYLHAYLSQKVMISAINDKSGDLMLIVKILEYKKLMLTSVAKEVTRLFA